MSVRASHAAGVRRGTQGLGQGTSGYTEKSRATSVPTCSLQPQLEGQIRPSGSAVVQEMSKTCVYKICVVFIINGSFKLIVMDAFIFSGHY